MSKAPEDVIQPISATPFTETRANAFGEKVEKQGLVATFPLDALREGLVFYLIYEDTPMTKDNFELKIDREMIEHTVR
jgi:hypothetical protein